MPAPTISQIWQQLCTRHNSEQRLTNQLWHELEIAYTAKDRHYHTVQHLEALLAHAAIHSSSIQDRDAVSFAIFYHDIIYSPLRRDNEEKSAELAVERLQQLGLPAHLQEHVRQMIMATKAHTDSPDADTRLLLDFDLSILGSDWEIYLNYTRQIRKEYSLVPYFLYRKGRKKVLQHFLTLPRIYKTQQFYEQYEEAAKQNIQRELLLLSR